MWLMCFLSYVGLRKSSCIFKSKWILLFCDLFTLFAQPSIGISVFSNYMNVLLVKVYSKLNILWELFSPCIEIAEQRRKYRGYMWLGIGKGQRCFSIFVMGAFNVTFLYHLVSWCWKELSVWFHLICFTN